ncbi:hypothetical protein ABZ297_19160 [Nonomuraea sp. NPDC005983]|uniref:hypothetical protein n=1 Tax=Nonomuraea sp. NPDC005983 TaxID=3155595 RepID=UPI0033A43403
MEYFIIAIAAMTLIFLVRVNLPAEVARRALPILLFAFVLRLVLHVMVMRSGVIEYGGDNLTYEGIAREIVRLWEREGFKFVTSEDISDISSVTFPCQVFAIVIYLCGGPASLACTAVVALLACALCIVIFRFARFVGADDRAALILLAVTAFMPAFLLHTSDTYKDGFNAFLVVASIGLGVSIARRFDLRRLLMLLPMLWALWYVRPYMVAMCVVPLLLCLIGVKGGFSLRRFAFAAILMCAVFASGGLSGLAPTAAIQKQFENGHSQATIRANASGGSGVVFEDGGDPWSDLDSKLVYTLLSPFPWTEGSLALQLGKVDAFIWYFLLYSAARGARRLWLNDRRILVILLLFIVPATIAYATTMANIGLIFRQRMPIIMITSLLSAVAWTRNPRDKGHSTTVLAGSQSTGQIAEQSIRSHAETGRV